MIVLVKIILAYFTGDFILQPVLRSAREEKKWVKSAKFSGYIFIHGLLVLLFLWDFSFWLLAVFVMVLHGAVNYFEIYVQKKGGSPRRFFLGPGLHLAGLLFLWFLWFEPAVNFGTVFNNPAFWIYITALVFISVVAGTLMKTLLQNWSVDLEDSEDNSLKNAGRYIGILERLFVFTFIITGNWSAIGFLIAAKSVFRFGDLRESKNRKLTEYILIGTLLSFGIAIATGILVPILIEKL